MRLTTIFVLFSICLFGSKCELIKSRQFPKNFIFGVATSAYQIEGAWNIDGKSESNWDRLAHTRSELIIDGSTGDVACDSYHNIEKDVAMIKELGVDFYRFSLAWSRIIPDPFINKINKKGVNYYNKLIDHLLKNGIQPMVTLFHWDLPQVLQDYGGFTNTLIIDYFIKYAKIAFEEFGDRVKLWTTFNEPHILCGFGYGGVTLAPAYNLSGTADYLCAYNLLKAHAQAYHLYDKNFKPKQNGRVSINLDGAWYEPASKYKNDIDAAERAIQFELGLYGNPIFSKDGDFPQVVKEYVEKRSLAEGFETSRLPKFTEEEIKYIRGTHDYFCLNHYMTALANNKEPEVVGQPSYENDKQVNWFFDPSWPNTAANLNKVVPWGLTKLLKWVKDNYGNQEIYITENGRGDHGGKMDFSRITYYNLYLNAVLDAIYNEGVNVTGYTAWSLMDNYEWSKGYTVKFGLYDVDFTSPSRKRTPKLSAIYFKKLVAARRLVDFP